jgi:glutaredoxin
MRFTVYAKDGCVYCDKIKTIFNLAEIDYVAYTLESGAFTYNQFVEVFGEDATFPQVVLNDTQSLGGCHQTIKYLRENNVL